MTNSKQLFIHDPHSTISNEKSLLERFTVIRHILLKNLEEMFPQYYMHVHHCYPPRIDDMLGVLPKRAVHIVCIKKQSK